MKIRQPLLRLSDETLPIGALRFKKMLSPKPTKRLVSIETL